MSCRGSASWLYNAEGNVFLALCGCPRPLFGTWRTWTICFFFCFCSFCFYSFSLFIIHEGELEKVRLMLENRNFSKTAKLSPQQHSKSPMTEGMSSHGHGWHRDPNCSEPIPHDHRFARIPVLDNILVVTCFGTAALSTVLNVSLQTFSTFWIYFVYFNCSQYSLSTRLYMSSILRLSSRLHLKILYIL